MFPARSHEIRRLRGLTPLVAAALLVPPAFCVEPIDMQQRAAQLKQLRWGMFICWSFSTFAGKEWTPGVTDLGFFKATGCDTDQWARTAKEAEMGYVLFLTKHHDGFCLWDTKTTDRKVTKSPLGRDVLAELRKSCDKHGIRLALYFSEGDWTWPGAVDGKSRQGGSNPEVKKAQLEELLTRYGPIEYIWFDHAVGDGGLSHKETIAWVKKFQPGCFVGFNHGGQEGADIRLGEMGRPGPLADHAAAGPHMRDAPSKSYLLAEFTYPILPPHKGGAVWFYSLPEHDQLCRPAEKLYSDYLGAVKYGNVFALDVGPNYEGRLRDVDVQTLRKVGRMIRDKAPEPVVPDEVDHLRAQPQAVEAWKDMRFGMFICWGPVSLTGKEIGWSRQPPAHAEERGFRCALKPRDDTTPTEVYDSLYKHWKPEQFDARQWVAIAQETGARYIILLIKHHDGFCLFDSKLTDHKITGAESTWRVDVMHQMADACHAAGMKLIVYYSQPDWHHPDYRGPQHERYIEYLHGQIRELLTGYGRIDGLWFDGLGNKADRWDAEKLFKLARGLQPWLLINNRCGLPGDYITPEQYVGRFNNTRPWESCVTLGTQWAWKPDDTLKPYTDAIKMLVACAVGDGNLALNTNPMPDGRIEPRQVESLRKIGDWLGRYGESIYGTRGGPFVAPQGPTSEDRKDRTRFHVPQGDWWGGSTRKGNAVYLHILRWPVDCLRLPPIKARVVGHRVLTGGQASLEQSEAGIEVSLPAESRDPLDTIIKLELDRTAKELPVARGGGPLATDSLTFGRKATASNFYRQSETYAPDKAVDGDDHTRWGCDFGTKAAWLEVDLGSPQCFARARISEPYGRVQRFELQARQGDTWQTFFRGTTIGEEFEARFEPVTAQQVRLNLLETTEGPSIWEFQLFAP